MEIPTQPIDHAEAFLDLISSLNEPAIQVLKYHDQHDRAFEKLDRQDAILRGNTERAEKCLELPSDYFSKRYTQDPLLLFRLFHYPVQPVGHSQWGVGEHTDYGLLTILLQDGIGGLQVK